MAQGDLVSLSQLKVHLGVQSSADDVLLAGLISQISRAICTYINRPFIWPRDVVDTFDGNGRARIQLRHWPVASVASVMINYQPVAAATAGGGSGWMLESGDDEPPGAMQMLRLQGDLFPRGLQNVSIAYRAGYQVSDEAQTIPLAAPYVVVAQQPFGAYVSDGGVAYANGLRMIAVAATPLQGQYALDGFGGYVFSQEDGGAGILFSYGYVPSDLSNCALEWAADRYRYRERIAMKSKSLGGQETAVYQIAAMPEFVAMALRSFVRMIAN
jgi:hypothetical protein